MSSNDLRSLLISVGLSANEEISREAMIDRLIEASKEVANF